MTNRNYTRPTVSQDWAESHETDMAVAVAIHAIADNKRSAQVIWENPTAAEWDHVTMAVTEYVAHGDFDYDDAGYCWGLEKVHVEQPE